MTSLARRTPSTKQALLVFGPQALSLIDASVKRVSESIRDSSSHGWILAVIKQLHSDLRSLVEKIPIINDNDASQQLEELSECLMSGQTPQKSDSSRSSNTFMTPFVVISHLVEYFELLRRNTCDDVDDRHAAIYPAFSETIGFCTGILSALAVSSSKTEYELQKYGAVAIRHAVLIGAIVDAQEVNNHYGFSKSYAAAWRSAKDYEAMVDLLDRDEQVRLTFHPFISEFHRDFGALLATQEISVPCYLI